MITCLHLHVSFPKVFRCFATASTSKTWRVSSLGRLCNLNGIVSYGYLHSSGYRVVQILGQFWKVHRVVMITFTGHPKSAEAWQVHHLDGDPGNNCLENLEYVTQGQNNQYSYASLSRKCGGLARSKPVIVRPNGSTEWTTCSSVTAAARLLGMSRATASRACRSMVPTSGHLLKFKEEDAIPKYGEEWRPMLDPVSGDLVGGRLVSSSGRITSCYGVIGLGYLDRMGYHKTSISQNGQKRLVSVHQLVAAAFIGLPQSGQCVNHKDLNKANNSADNLEYLTAAENRAHFLAHSACTRRTGLKPVWSRAYGSDEPWRWHLSLSSAAKELELNAGSISLCVNGKARRAGNYEFKFADVPESHPLPGEEWRDVDIHALQQDKWSRLWEDLVIFVEKVVFRFGSLVLVGCVISLDHPFGHVSEGHSLASGRENKVKGEVELKGT